MAKIKPTSKDVRRRYRETLPGPEQQSAFDELGRLIDSPRDDLPWHHRVGELVGREPVQASEALHVAAPVEDHVSIALWPAGTDAGATVSDTAGLALSAADCEHGPASSTPASDTRHAE